MKTKIHRDAIYSEIASLEQLLSALPENSLMGRKSLETRLRSLRQEAEELDAQVDNSATVALIFDGEPVTGSRAIDADFAGKALQDYQELLNRVVSYEDRGPIAERGPVPLRHKKQAELNITSLMHGSFGFVLEEKGADQGEIFETGAKLAVSKITNILEGLSQPDNAWFDENVAALDIRVFQSLKRFVDHLYKSNSTIRLAEDDRELRLGREKVSRAFERVSKTELIEEDETIQGELLGIIPIQRRFEFRPDESDDVIQGRVADNLSADYLERIEREEIIAGKRWTAVIRTKTILHPDGRHVSVSRTLMDLIEA